MKFSLQCLTIFILFFSTSLFSAKVSGNQAESEGVLNKLLTPGPLIFGHRDLESVSCLKCHSTGQGIPNENCLSCHKEIRESMKLKKTFHGLANKDCFVCHADHRGRDFDTTEVNQKEFDHTKTGYKLVGKHFKIECKDCHKEKRTKKYLRPEDLRYFGTVQNCSRCHQKEDVHKFTGELAKKDCNACHNEIRWKDVSPKLFDHEKISKWPLLGKHMEIKCSDCHVDKTTKAIVYKWPVLANQKCLTCHKDFHQENLGPKFQNGSCDKCHGIIEKWKIPKFNHGVTDFDYKGAHLKAPCIKCHIQAKTDVAPDEKVRIKYVGLKKECWTCHKDVHGFNQQQSVRFKSLKKCEACHFEENWKRPLQFQHNLDTKFRIDGKHLNLACFACHLPIDKKLMLKTKISEREKTDISPLPLIKERTYHWPELEQKNCNACHENPHIAKFEVDFKNKSCQNCHNSEDWKTFRKTAGPSKGFDHDLTRFKLTGEHLKIACKKCHESNGTQKFKLEGAERQFCYTCHQNVHLTQFDSTFENKSCQECHNSTNFKEITGFDHEKTRFPLKGTHFDIKNDCIKCHKESQFILKTKTPHKGHQYLFTSESRGFCEDCHANVHKTQFHENVATQRCDQCHTSVKFAKDIKVDHKQTRFELKGKHIETPCVKCHITTEKKFPGKTESFQHLFKFNNFSQTNCILCHKDKHKGEFGNKCYNCHDEINWKKARDFHKNFSLTGVHFSLQCQECHTHNRSLGGMSNNCLLCHLKDDPHNSTLPDCQQCHLQSFWEQTSFRHSLTSFPLRGAHRGAECNACHGNAIYQGLGQNCVNCHLSEAQSVTSTPHIMPQFENCEQCHNQFIFH